MRKLVLALAATVAFAGTALAEPVRISVGIQNCNNLPFPVAAGLGLYEKEGLEVTVENFASGGSKTLQALVAGSTDIAVWLHADHTIQMQSQNKAVVGFVLLARNSGLCSCRRKKRHFRSGQARNDQRSQNRHHRPGLIIRLLRFVTIYSATNCRRMMFR